MSNLTDALIAAKLIGNSGGSGGTGISDNIDIIGTDKKLKDLSGITVGFDLPDIPGEPDTTVSKVFNFGEGTGDIILSEDLPFDFGVDFDDLSIYSYQDQTVSFPKPLTIHLAFDTGEIKTSSAAGAYYDKYDDNDNTYYEAVLVLPTSDFECQYIPVQESQSEEYHGLVILLSSRPSGATQVTVTLTQKGTSAVTGRVSEIAAKYIESPEVEKGLKFNALKEVSVGYVKEGDSITVVNDGTGETTTIGSDLTYRWVSDEFPFDISGDTEESHGNTLIKLDIPIAVEFSNPAIAQEVGNSLPYISSYPDTSTGGITVYAGIVSPKSPEPLFFYAEDDVELSTFTLLKGLWVIDMTTPQNVAVTSLMQGDPDTIHKIDAKFLDIPPVVDGEGTTDLKNFSKIAVGGVKGFEFTYDAASYEIVTTPEVNIIKVAEFEEVDITNEDGNLKTPINYRYSLKTEGSSSQELTGTFDVVSTDDPVMLRIQDSTADSNVKEFIYLIALENDYSLGGISLTRGVWGLLMPEGEMQIIPLHLAQESIVKIPANYIDGAGYDATFVLGPGKAALEIYSYEFDFDSLVDKLNADEPLNVKVDFVVADGSSFEQSPLVVTRIGVVNLDAYAINIYVDSSNNSIKEEYYQDFPGYIEITSNSSIHWITSPEDISIKFSVAGSGSYNMIASGTYNQLYNLVRTGQMPSIKAHITAQRQQMN